MYRVMLVDDEPALLNSLKKYVPWEEYGFEVACALQNGREALETLETLKKQDVDVVITDVRMPVLDGLQLAQEVKRRYPLVEIVILSGYNEFEYVRTALRSGAMEYLTKPIGKKELEEVLAKVKQRIRRREKLDRDMESMKSEIERHEKVIRNQMYCNVLNNRMEWWGYENQNIALLEDSAANENFILCVFTFERQKTDLKQDFYWVLFEHFLKEHPLHEKADYFWQEWMFYYVLPCREHEFSKEETEQRVSELMEEFEETAEVGIWAGISLCHHSIRELSVAGIECRMALEEAVGQEHRCCIFYDDIKWGQHERTADMEIVLNRISAIFRSSKKEKVQEGIGQIFYILDLQKADYQQYCGVALLLLSEIRRMTMGENERREIQHVMERLLRHRSIEELKEEVYQSASQMMTAIDDNKKTQKQELVKETCCYLEKNFGKDLTLESISRELGVSKGYLCSVIKQETGETLFYHLTRIRLEEAKHLLGETDHKIYTIAYMVGYKDYAYFAQVFKKSVGITAGEYRELMKN